MTNRTEKEARNTGRDAKRAWVSPSLRVIASRDAEAAASGNATLADGQGYS